MMTNLTKISKRQILIVLTGVLIVFTDYLDISAADLRAGIFRINITKDKPTGLINDPLYAKALVLDDGKTKAVIISMDIVYVEDEFLSKVRTRIQNELKIDGNNVMINASHNHWDNEQLAEDYLDRTVKAVKEASQNLVPVRAGAGSGTENRLTMNRRLILKNGKEWTIRRATPEPEDDQVKGIAEPFDPEIGILRIDKTDGKPMAVLFNFADHNYTGVPNRGATAGFPGFASKVIEENLGNGSLALFSQGCGGDVTPILYKDVNAPKQDEIQGTLLGLSTLQAWRNTTVKKDASISVIREDLALPVRTDVKMHIDSLEARKKVILDYFKGEGCGAHGAGVKLNFKSFLPLYVKYLMSPQFPSDYSYRYMQEKKIGINDLEMMDADNKRDMEKYLNCIYKMEELITTEANLGFLKESDPKSPIKAEIMGMKIGDFVLVTFSGELFSQIGLNIKKASKYKYTFVSGYTNGFIMDAGAYAPTNDAYAGDAYEVSLSKLAPEWQKIFEEKALEIIKKL
jgi:hypothetical protein